MTNERVQAGHQKQDSRQSGAQGGGDTGKPDDTGKTREGIGSSQGLDREQPKGRPSAGTPDVERGAGGGDVERDAGERDSLVQDPTGAYKERP